MPLSSFTNDELLKELNKRNPWLDREQAAREIGDLEPATLRARDSRKSHSLKRYKFGKNGRVKYRYSDVQEFLRQQQIPE